MLARCASRSMSQIVTWGARLLSRNEAIPRVVKRAPRRLRSYRPDWRARIPGMLSTPAFGRILGPTCTPVASAFYIHTPFSLEEVAYPPN